MNRRLQPALLLAFLSPLSLASFALAQELPQEAQWAMESSLQRLESGNAMATRDDLAETVDADELETFLERAVLRLRFLPDGTFQAYTLEGGDLLAFELGKQRVELGGDPSRQDRWILRTGEYPQAKRPQKLSLEMKAGSREVTLDCYNKLKRTEDPVTYSVGPLNGLFCMGLVDDGS